MKCEKVWFSLMIFALRNSQIFKERQREWLSQNGDLPSPVLCIPGLVLWVPGATSHLEAHEGWWLPARGIFDKEARREGQPPVLPAASLPGADGAGKEVCFAISRAVLFLRLKRDSRRLNLALFTST